MEQAMIIASSSVLLASQHSSVDTRTVKESLTMWVGNRRPDFEGRSTNPPHPHVDQVSLSSEGRAAQKADPVKDAADAVNNDPRLQLLISMVEAMTGRKIKIMSLKDLATADTPAPAQIQGPNQAANAQPAQPSAGFGVEYDRHEVHYETEHTAFAATGVVTTADGKEIKFDLNLTMSREHLEQNDVSLRLGDVKKQDPLVINFGGTAAQLTDTKFSFDLNSDGAADQISFVGAGSGFLALDKNADGKINNGSELFGTASGNGFQELATYDQDKNGWIDESDAVFAQLKVWTKDAEGQDALSTLAQKNVGAIYLGNVSTPFDIKNGQNQLDGQVKSSGVYLKEDGGVGTVQQIDLAV
jgi:hypothetical protein